MRALSIQALTEFLISFLTYVKWIKLNTLDIQTFKTKQEANLHFTQNKQKRKKTKSSQMQPALLSTPEMESYGQNASQEKKKKIRVYQWIHQFH